ncbi:MAG: MoaD/ThiS family protein [Dethiobacteria bacterium]|nr:MoaD/ThiS family protein [Bacillota bacterium]MDW7730013.1 MoaD/ThiS family protein [Bacillota bacterium]
MLIKLRLHDILKEKVGAGRADGDGILKQQLRDGSTVNDLVVSLGLNREYVGLIIVNGRQAAFEFSLNEGDSVELFSPMSGG